MSPALHPAMYGGLVSAIFGTMVLVALIGFAAFQYGRNRP